jgi:hypothetical protein
MFSFRLFPGIAWLPQADWSGIVFCSVSVITLEFRKGTVVVRNPVPTIARLHAHLENYSI